MKTKQRKSVSLACVLVSGLVTCLAWKPKRRRRLSLSYSNRANLTAFRIVEVHKVPWSHLLKVSKHSSQERWF
ncbi:Uncharacterized protein TCM_046041 [Theobroma cacao]|uniref:Uncharacterized protein n=1 Tax=Theobroma cacao TaxID=3641 RepID=S1RWE7_THECC|nr:Uncharacterized protein TCM_046041 [Theobroma cacao]